MNNLKNINKYIRNVIASILAVYITLILLLHLPIVQNQLGGWVADALSKKIDSKVKIGNINLGLLNRFIIDDLSVFDQQNKPLLFTAKAAVTIDLWALMTKGEISINTAQLFGLKAFIKREATNSPLNCQFIIDAFKSKKTSKSSNLNLHIYSFLVRHANINYDVTSKAKTPGVFNSNHIAIKNLSVTAVLRNLTSDSLNADIKRLSLYEVNSGFNLSNANLNISANNNNAYIPTLKLDINRSHILLSNTKIDYDNFKIKHNFKVSTSINHSSVNTRDFGIFYRPLKRFNHVFFLRANKIETSNSHVYVKNLTVKTRESDFNFNTSFLIKNLRNKKLDFSIQTTSCQISKNFGNKIADELQLSPKMAQLIRQATPITLSLSGGKNNNVTESLIQLKTQIGDLHAKGTYNHLQGLTSEINVNELDLKEILNSPEIGKISFQTTTKNLNKVNNIFYGSISTSIKQLQFKGYEYQNIQIDANSNENQYQANLQIKDPNILLSFTANMPASKYLNFNELSTSLDLSSFNPHALHLTKDFANTYYSIRMESQTQGQRMNELLGHIRVDSASILNSGTSYTSSPIDLYIQKSKHGRQISLISDFINATIDGDTSVKDVIASLKQNISYYLPAIVPTSTKRNVNTVFSFNFSLKDTPILHHFIKDNYRLEDKIEASGYINTRLKTASIHLETPQFVYNDTEYDNIKIDYVGTPDAFNLQTSLLRRLENSALNLNINTNGHKNTINTNLEWEQASNRPSKGGIATHTHFNDFLGKLQTHIDIDSSNISLNDTLWHINPSSIDIIGKQIHCNKINISNADRYLQIDGSVSDSPSDSLIVKLNDIQVEYVLDLVNFTAVGFRGRASGKAKVSNVFSKPQFEANLLVEHFSLEDGDLGTAHIHANWDNQIEGINVAANIYDSDSKGQARITRCHGYISPAQNDIQLKIEANNTDAYFLESFLGSVFSDINGDVNGIIHIVGPLGDIGIVGDVCTNLKFRLKSTNVVYQISPSDTIRLRPYQFQFRNIHITDTEGHQGIVNGTVSHKNVKNFAYSFHVDMQQLLAYKEDKFNADKFMGKVYANGQLSLRGADRHPLFIEADVTPTRGSTFAYDVATPDAITSSSFITFNNLQTKSDTLTVYQDNNDRETINSNNLEQRVWTNNDYLLYYRNKNNERKKQDSEYTGDIYMDIDIHLNPHCAIKLRMDNVDDGYITTYGSGNLQALYHNKGSFTLSGTYAIHTGRYRLYLQDIIYRDLDIQEGSSVVFNGNPFDAGLHLICQHTLNSVPLSDLTKSTSTYASNKIKVNCILDITGKLGNMNFKFDLNFPNVSEETKQLVRSLISTDEEMNTQMIYLLGVGRFYNNGKNNSSNENTNSQAVNSLLSSTISGQINQMLSNIIGSNSKWNFGTGLSTGEQGWQDLDIEGILTGSLLNDRLLINGNFGYRDNALTQNSSFIGDFDIKWRLKESGNTYLKAYNKGNDRYFTKATLNTQGVGISYQKDFENWRSLLRFLRKKQLHNKSIDSDSTNSDTLRCRH